MRRLHRHVRLVPDFVLGDIHGLIGRLKNG
jgi:hypothetical protein